MPNVRQILEARLAAAIREVFPDAADAPAIVMQAQDERFGDYQANGAMALAKRLGKKPRDVAAEIIAKADLAGIAETPEIAGPGFINITLSPDWLAARLADVLTDERLGVPSPAQRQTIVVDYSAPNLAKEMHVGHLRSTIIGDALVRVLEFLGHTVIRQNHVGDWGTQFGMLVACFDLETRDLDERTDVIASWQGVHITDLEEFYRRAKRLFDENPEFASVAREFVVRLQGGDPEVKRRWEHLKYNSLGHCDEVYTRLGVLLTAMDVRGESAYNGVLPDIVEALEAKDLLTESEGARCVFLPEFTAKDGSPLPLIVQKSDEGYLYATTDLAAIQFRCGKGKADGNVDWVASRILYVVDARQSLHFRMVFAVAKAAGFASEDVSLEHVDFGMMLGPDNRPFKTREGGTVKLMDLIDEAEKRARTLLEEKQADPREDEREALPEEEREHIARIVGIGALKYADLAQNRTKDYVFSWNKMLSLDGNTAPYMQYAFARIHSIARKGGIDLEKLAREPAAGDGFTLGEPPERRLAVALLQFPETVEAVAADCVPHVLCGYLYRLAGAFMGFYETCPVLKADEPVRTSRLRLCALTARVIEKGLGLLGIETAERM